MDLLRLDPDSGGASRVTVEDYEEEVFLGRNPKTEISDTLISRQHCSVYICKKLNTWKLKPKKQCFLKRSADDCWQAVSDEVILCDGDQLSLLKDKYIFKVDIKPLAVNVGGGTVNVANASQNSDVDTVIESEKPKNASTPSKNGRLLPSWCRCYKTFLFVPDDGVKCGNGC
jgi:FHA domain